MSAAAVDDMRSAIYEVAHTAVAALPDLYASAPEFIRTGNHLYGSFFAEQNNPPIHMARKTYMDAPYVPTAAEIAQVPVALLPVDGGSSPAATELTWPQVAIICALAYGPCRQVAVDIQTPRRSQQCRFATAAATEAPDAGERRVRMLFAPTGTGKTLMASLAAMLALESHYAACARARAPDALKLANVVIVSAPRATMGHWIDTLRACCAALSPRGRVFDVLPRRVEDVKVTRTYLKRAAQCSTGGLFVVVQSSEVGSVVKRMAVAGHVPYGVIDDEFVNERVSLRASDYAFVLGITATPSGLVDLAYRMRADAFWRREIGFYTFWSPRMVDQAIADNLRVCGMDAGSHYYAWLVREAVTLMPPGFHVARVQVRDRSLARDHLQHRDRRHQDPTHQIKLADLCSWLQLDAAADTTAPMPLATLLGAFNAPETSLRAHECMQRLRRRVTDGEIGCVICYEDADALHVILITPCCTNLVCDACYARLARCPCCREPLRDAETCIVHDDAPTPTPTPTPAPADVVARPRLRDMHEFLTHVREAAPFENAFAACDAVLDMLYDLGMRRVILAWRFEESTLTLEKAQRKFIVVAPGTQRREGRAMVERNIVDFTRGETTENDRMYVLLINAAHAARDTEVAGINLPLADAVVFTGAAQQQIIGRVLRMGQPNQQSKLVVHFATF